MNKSEIIKKGDTIIENCGAMAPFEEGKVINISATSIDVLFEDDTTRQIMISSLNKKSANGSIIGYWTESAYCVL